MKNKIKYLTSILLAVCLLTGLLSNFSIVSTAEPESTDISSDAIDYDTAGNGDILYTVNFNFDETYTKQLVDNASIASVSDTEKGAGSKLTYTGKSATGAAYYGGYLKNYPITDHVYTISYYIENTDTENIRVGVQFLNVVGVGTTDKYRIGINTTKEPLSNGTLKGMTLLENGTNRLTLTSVERAVDVTNNNRQYFRAVVDGENMCVSFYAMNNANEYELLYRYKIATLNFDYLSIGMFSHDAIPSDDSVSVGDVQIIKGNIMSENEYRSAYDSAEAGDTLYEIDFEELAGGKGGWTYMRNMSGSPVIEGGAITFTNSSSTPQLVASYFPDLSAHSYGSYTYEFYVDSDNRTGINVLGIGTPGGYYYAIGFSYFNSTAANMFMKGSGWANVNDAAFASAPYNCAVDVYLQNQTPKTGDDITCNVKIEVNTSAKTITNYILTNNGFVKTAGISYEGTLLAPVVYPYAYNGGTNAIYKNMVIRKGLTASSSDDIGMLDLQVGAVTDGKLAVRFVGRGNADDYNRVGFEIDALFTGGSYSYDYSSHEVYKKLISPEQDNNIPAVFSESSGVDYLFGYTLSEIPADITVRFTVRPYALLKNGSRLYGAEATYIIENGVLK